KEVHSLFRSLKYNCDRFEIAQSLFAYDPATYRDEALAAARASLAGRPERIGHIPVAEWMVANFGTEVLPDLVAYLASPVDVHRWWKAGIVAAAQSLKQKSLPVLQAALNTNDSELALSTLPYLISLGDTTQDALIVEALERGFRDSGKVVQFVNLAARWKISLIAEPLWSLLAHKSKTIRDAAARAL